MKVTIPRMSVETRNAASDELTYLGSFLVDGGRILVGGGTGGATLLASSDGGKTFAPRSTPKSNGLRRLTRAGDLVVVTGEFGTLAVSDDFGLTWTPLSVDTTHCLFRFIEDAAGVRWVVGDRGFVARADKGTWDFREVDTGTKTQFLEAEVIGGRLALFGKDGKIWWRTEGGFEPQTVWNDALNVVTETKAGTLLVAANNGGIFRSEDKGKTFARIESHSKGHIEEVRATTHGVFASGADGVLLFSNDDGKTFAPVAHEMTGVLWSIAEVPGGILVCGDRGAVWSVSVSQTETVDVEVPEVDAERETDPEVAQASADDDDDSDDDDDGDDDSEPAAGEAANAVPMFATVEEASARWIKEGKAFISALNGYVDRVYQVGVNKAGKEPSETREDMADYVRDRLVELNAKGEHKRARELFPPAYEPFDYDRIGRPVRQISRLPDGRTLVQVESDVHVLERDKITDVDATFFAVSRDRRYVGLADGEAIHVYEGFGGKKVRSIPLPPKEGGEVLSAQLTPDGDAALVATDGGVLWLSEHGFRYLLPDTPPAPGESFSASYIHAAMSPNGRFVALGCQDGAHILIDRKTGEQHSFDTVSSYPHLAYFHDSRPEVLFNSVHGLYGSGSLAVSLDAVTTGKGEQARIFDRRSWLFSVASLPDAYLLGDRGGYVWCIDAEREQRFYLFVGSSLTSMDVSPDKKTLLIGSYAGYVIEIDLTAEGRDPTLLTNGNVRETARWVFWRGHEPMIW